MTEQQSSRQDWSSCKEVEMCKYPVVYHTAHIVGKPHCERHVTSRQRDTASSDNGRIQPTHMQLYVGPVSVAKKRCLSIRLTLLLGGNRMLA